MVMPAERSDNPHYRIDGIERLGRELERRVAQIQSAVNLIADGEAQVAREDYPDVFHGRRVEEDLPPRSVGVMGEEIRDSARPTVDEHLASLGVMAPTTGMNQEERSTALSPGSLEDMVIEIPDQALDHLVIESRRMIEMAANFALMGTPRAYMEIEGIPQDDELKRFVYKVYALRGRDPNALVRKLSNDIFRAIIAFTPIRTCLLWRQYPVLRQDPGDANHLPVVGTYNFYMRFALFDENWDQLELPYAEVRDGAEYPEIGHG
jgi:hypothetical protein